MLDTKGHFVTFDDSTIVHYLDHVTIFDNYVEVLLKAGVTIAINRCDMSGSERSGSL